MEQKILQLQTQISDLIKWKDSFANQQVVKPLGTTSKKIIQKDLLVSNGVFGTTITPDCYLEIIDSDGILWWISADEQ